MIRKMGRDWDTGGGEDYLQQEASFVSDLQVCTDLCWANHCSFSLWPGIKRFWKCEVYHKYEYSHSFPHFVDLGNAGRKSWFSEHPTGLNTVSSYDFLWLFEQEASNRAFPTTQDGGVWYAGCDGARIKLGGAGYFILRAYLPFLPDGFVIASKNIFLQYLIRI